MILEKWQKDPEFQGLSDEEKKLALLNYFDRELADQDFFALSGEMQVQVKDNFLRSEGFETKTEGVIDWIDKKLGSQLVEGVKETTRHRATGLAVMVGKLGEDLPEGGKELYKGLSDKLIQFARHRAWEPTPEFQKARSYVEDFVRTIPQIGSQMFAYLLGGPLASFGLMGTEILGSTYQRLRDQGVPEDRAFYAAAANAIIQGSLETIGIRKIASVWKPQKHILQRLKSIGTAAGTEWLTEFLQAYPDMMIEVIATSPDKTRLEQFKTIVDELWETTKQGAYEGTLTAPWAFLGIAAPSQVTDPTGEPRPTTVDVEGIAKRIQGDVDSGAVSIETLQELRGRLEDTEPEAAALDRVIKGRVARTVEKGKEFAQKYPDLVSMVGRAVELNEGVQADKEDAVDQDLWNFLKRAETHIPEAMDLTGKSDLVEGLNDNEFKNAVKLITPIVERAKKFQDRKAVDQAQKIIEKHPELQKIINQIQQILPKEAADAEVVRGQIEKEREPSREAERQKEVTPEEGRDLEAGQKTVRVLDLEQAEEEKLPERLTKREKSSAEYNEYIDQLSPDEKKTFSSLIEEKPESPGLQLTKLKKKIEKHRKIVAHDTQKEIEKEAKKVETEPTEAQKEKGEILKPTRSDKDLIKSGIINTDYLSDSSYALSFGKKRINPIKIIDNFVSSIRTFDRSVSKRFPESAVMDIKDFGDLLAVKSFRKHLDGFVNIPADMPDRSIESSLNKASSDGAVADTHLFGNGRNAEAIRTKGFDSLDIKNKSIVKNNMLSSLENTQIFRSIVELVPVDVMNSLIGKKWSTEKILNNQSMFLDRLSIAFDNPVKIRRFVNAVATSLPKSFALRITKEITAFEKTAQGPIKGGVAVGTEESQHKKEIRTKGKESQQKITDKFALENLPRGYNQVAEIFTKADLPALKKEYAKGDERASLLKDAIDILEKPETVKTPEQIKKEAGIVSRETYENPIKKLRSDLNKKGSGRIDGIDYKILQHETTGGYYYQKTEEGVRYKQGGAGPNVWSRETAIGKAVSDAVQYVKEPEINQKELSTLRSREKRADEIGAGIEGLREQIREYEEKGLLPSAPLVKDTLNALNKAISNREKALKSLTEPETKPILKSEERPASEWSADELLAEWDRQAEQVEPTEVPPETAKQKLVETKDHLANAVDAFKKINSILGEKGEIGPEVDEAKWEQIKPILQYAWDEILAAGKSGKEFVELALKNLSPKGRPYFAKFIREEIEGAQNVQDEGKTPVKDRADTDLEQIRKQSEALLRRGYRQSGPGLEAERRAREKNADVTGSTERGGISRTGPPGRARGEEAVEREPTAEGAELGERPAREEDRNHVIEPEDVIAPPGSEGKIKANIAAIQLLKKLESENRNPTTAEKKILVKYTGWGAFSQKIFNRGFTAYVDKHNEGYEGATTPDRYYWDKDQLAKYNAWEKKYGKKLHPGLGGFMTEEEWKSAEKSTINAHFTSKNVITSMWDLARRLGFKGGTVLEPAAGIGHFFGLMPQDLAARSALFGVELDNLSGSILKKLYPEANVQVIGFQDSKGILDNSIDLTITNVPFGDIPISDKSHPDYHRFSLHNYFIARSLTATKPGGMVIAITSAYTMDSRRNGKVREYFSNVADLIGAVRLPNSAFRANAGTEVVTDILVFRKKDSNAASVGEPFREATFIEDKHYQKVHKKYQKAKNNLTEIESNKPKKDAPIYVKGYYKKQREAAKDAADEAFNSIRALRSVNEYFHKNPDMVLGKHAYTGSMYAAETYTVNQTGDLVEQLQEIVKGFPENIAGEGTDLSKLEKVEIAGLDDKEGTLIEKDGEIRLVENGRVVTPRYTSSSGKTIKITSPAQKKKLRVYLKIREDFRNLLSEMQSEEATDDRIKTLQKNLNDIYDKFVKKYGKFNGNTANSFFRRLDNDFALVDALEVEVETTVDGKKTTVFEKAPIFTKRTLFPFLEPKTAENMEDATNLSIIYRGELSPSYISELIDEPDIEKVRDKIVSKGFGFVNPSTGLIEQKDLYLSGNVKQKLRIAKATAETDKTYQPNIKALEKVIPEDIDIEFITFRLGSSWIPADTVRSFLDEVLDVTAEVEHSKTDAGDRWHISNERNVNNVKNRDTFGTNDYYAHGLVDLALNLKRAKVMVEERTPEGTRKYEDKEASQENNIKIKEISDEFVRWAKTHGKWSKELAEIYNEEKNGTILRQHSVPSIQYYPNASHEVVLRDFQKKAVSRSLQESVLLAYGVGTGKTYITITTAMEMRRIGTARKPVIVVHNQTVDQYRNSFKTLYPGAKVLIPDMNQRNSKMRKKLLVSMATGDWDAIVLPQSFFDGIANNPERERAFVEEQLDMIEQSIEEARAEGDSYWKVKDLVKLLERRRQRLEDLLERRKDEALLFEDMGIDAILVDEVHAYKRSEFYTKLSGVKGIDQGSSQRSTSLILKSEFVRNKTGGKNIITATGTPISNTLAELWTMLRYVRPDLLEEYGVTLFDEFATSFGDITIDTEETASGFKEVERFSKYTNGPELLTMFFSGADVQLTKESNLNLPSMKGNEPKAVVNEKSAELTAFIRSIIEQWRAWEQLNGKEKRAQRHVPLMLYGQARKAAVDLRLIDPLYYKDDPASKINAAVNNIYDVWKRTSDKRSTQIVFCDLIHDRAQQPQFNLHKDIQNKLVKKGVPQSEVLLFSLVASEKKQSVMKDQIRTGEARVIIGTTGKLGIGVDIADKLIASHHVTVPDRPMDIEQRDGRIIRQGNENEEVEIYHYATKDTLDSVMFNRLMRKQKGADQVLTGDIDGRDFDDPFSVEQATFGEFAAAASGKAGKLLFEKTELMNKEHKYRIAEQAYVRKVSNARRRLGELPDEINQSEKAKKDAENLKDYLNKQFPERKLENLTYEGETLPRKKIYEKLSARVKETVDNWESQFIGKPMGDFAKNAKQTSWGPRAEDIISLKSGDIDIAIDYDLSNNYNSREKPSTKLRFREVEKLNEDTGKWEKIPVKQSGFGVYLKYGGETVWSTTIGRNELAAGFTRNFNGFIARALDKPTDIQADINERTKEIAEYEKISKSKFEYTQDLQDIRKRIGEINTELTSLDKIEEGEPAPEKLEAVKENVIQILGSEKGTSEAYNDLVDLGKHIIRQGHTKFEGFVKQLKGHLSEVWQKVKKLARRIFRDAKQAIANERGAIKIGKEPEGDKAAEYLKRLRGDKDYKKYRDKLRDQDDFRKEGRDLFSYAKQRFGKGFVDRDMRWYNAAFETPYALGKRFSSMKKAVDSEIAAAEQRNRELFNDYQGKLGELQYSIGKDKAAVQELRNLIWKWDNVRFPESAVPTNWYKPISEGEDIEINPSHYSEVEKYLTDQGVSKPVVDAFLTIRKKLDQKFVDIDRTMRTEKLDPTGIEEYRSEIHKTNNYFPHRRTGNTHVTITRKETGKTVYREHYNRLKDRVFPIDMKAPARAEKWLKSAIKNNELEGKAADYEIHNPASVKQLPDEVFFQVPIEAMQQVLNVAGKRLEQSRVEYEAERLFTKHKVKTKAEAIELARKRLGADLERALSQAVAETFKVRGWGRHAVRRRNIPGHETDDVFGILFDYLSGYAGFKTKIQRAREHSKTLRGIDARKNPTEYRYVSNYVKDMLSNQDAVDRAVDTLRGLFFVRYLGFVVKSGVINLTQNVVLAAPVLSSHTSGAHLKLSKAMKDTRRALTSKAAWTLSGEVKYPGLKENEQKALHELIESGAAMDLFVRELKGNMPKVGWGKHFRKFVDYSGIFMQIAEKFNRASTGLAAYRVAVKEKGMGHDEAVKFAKQIIYDSHFLYGKHNLPSAFRGGPARKVLRSGYTFRSFTHNYLNIMAHMFKNQGWEGKVAATRSLRNIFIMGGLTSIPFFKAFSEALMWVLDDEDEDFLTNVRSWLPYNWLKDIVTYGLPGIAGIDLTGSLSIEVPRDWRDLVGIPYAVIEDTVNMFKSWKSGQKFRALSESPFTPISVRNAVRGLILYTYGQTTRSGKAITGHPSKVEPQKLTAAQAIKKSALGFQPTILSKGYAAYEAVQRVEDYIGAKQKEFADRYVNAYRRGDSEGQRQVILEIREWNKQAQKEGKLHLMIDIKRMIESRIRPAWETIRKAQRPNYLRVVEEWQ